MADVGRMFGGICSNNDLAEEKSRKIDEPINVRLQKLHENAQKRKSKMLKPRDYQQELYLHTLKENTIIFLGTGLGKTLVVVLFVQSPYLEAKIQKGLKVVFMAPTQDLVKQQADYISSKCLYKSRVYCGRTCQLGIHIDYWDKDTWTNELKSIDLMFMTPQIFCSAISNNLLNWENFAACIFDEVHHASKPKKNKQGSPYYQLLNHYHQYYRTRTNAPRPRLLGLTASLINNQPKTGQCIVDQVRAMERLMSAKCVTDRDVMESRPRMVTHSHYPSDVGHSDPVTMILQSFERKLKPIIDGKKAKFLTQARESTLKDEEKQTLAFINRLKLASSGFSIKPFSFGKVLNHLVAIRQNCGIWCLAHILYKLVVALKCHSDNRSVSLHIRPIYKDLASFFKQILFALKTFFGPVSFDISNCVANESCRQLLLVYSSPKLNALLDVLLNEYRRAVDTKDEKSTFSCIIFVKSRVEVVALNSWLQNVSAKFPEFGFIKSDYAVGLAATMASKWACITKRKANAQSRMLDDFRNGRLNTIVTTSVLEEGIDLPVCSTVIRYDEATTFRVYVQSRGRARQKISSYVSLCPTDKCFEAEDRINKFNDFEFRIKELLHNKQICQTEREAPPPTILALSPLDTHDKFTLKDGAICLSGSQARIVLHKYCSKLLSSRPYSCGAQYEHIQPTRSTHRVILYLPPGCPIRTGISGNEKSSPVLAANSAVVAAIKALYEANELDDNAIPHKLAISADQILSEKSLLPNLKPLSREFEGEVIKFDGDRVMNEFPSKVSDIKSPLSRDCQRRTYKLLRISFVPDEESSRKDVRKFFLEARFGLIIDSSMPEDFIPRKLHGHYGQFEVTSIVIDNRLSIQTFETHNKYLSFTHKLLTRCLRIGFIDATRFHRNCLFYLVLLDNQNHIATQWMQNLFRPPFNASIKQGDVVKLRRTYWRDQSDDKKMYLVLRVRDDMDATSSVPGMNGVTFLEYAERSGQRLTQNRHQPVIEIQQVSTQIAQTRPSRKVDKHYSSRPLYFLQDSLDIYCTDAACVFQAFNYPEIFYRLYFAAAAGDLDANFLQETSHRRRELAQLQPQHQELPESEDNVIDYREEGEEEEVETDDQENEDISEDIESEEEEEDDYSDSYVSTDSSDEEGNNKELPPLKLLNMPVRKETNLSKFGDDDDSLEEWDMSQYNVEDLKKLNFELTQSWHQNSPLSCSSNYEKAFALLSDKTQIYEDSIIKRLQEIQRGIKSDADYLDDEQEFRERRQKVDVSLEPPIKFDRNLSASSRELNVSPLLEALTLRCSGEKYNLEVLENIGDAYLKYFTSVVLFKQLDCDPAHLTSARMNLTSNKTFNHLAKSRRLGSYAVTRPFDAATLSKLLDGKRIFNQLRPKDLADLFEAIVGSYLLHCSEFEAVLSIGWLGLDGLVREELFAQLHPGAVVFERHPSALLDFEDNATRDYYKMYEARAATFQSIISYKFNDISYLVQAFTHASAPQKCTDTYERLEFLGDGILDYLVNRTLVARLEASDRAQVDNFRLTPGQLSSSKSALVNNKTFAKLALQYCYDFFIHHSNQEILSELDRVHIAVKEDKDFKFLDLNDFDRISKLLADVFESVAGAIYLDSGCSLDEVWRVYYRMMKQAFDDEIANPTKNVVATLYEMFPGPKRISFDAFKVQSENGEDIIGVKCAIYGFGEFLGEGLTKKQAKYRAIVEAIGQAPSSERLEQLNRDYYDVCKRRGELGGDNHQGGRGQARGGARSSRGAGNRIRGTNRRPTMRFEDSHQRGDCYSGRGRRSYSGRQ